jgi:hypothetical protein
VSFKQKLKTFFKTKDASDAAVDILRHFILPFSRQFKGRNVVIDDVLSAFFALEDRRFVMLEAKHSFRLPGKYYVAGNKAIAGAGPRAIKKGQRFLAVLDRKDKTVKMETGEQTGEYHAFLLQEFEFRTIEDHLNVI